MTYCKKCRHDECNNLFGDFPCETSCEICIEKKKVAQIVQQKTLSITDLNEEATIFIIHKRDQHVTKAIVEFISHLQRRAMGNETKKPEKKRKGVKKHGK